MLARLGRFALARGLGEGADVEAYTGNYRAPELWSGTHPLPSLSTESWALAAHWRRSPVAMPFFSLSLRLPITGPIFSERQLQQSYPTLAKLAPRVRVLVQLLVHERADRRKAIKIWRRMQLSWSGSVIRLKSARDMEAEPVTWKQKGSSASEQRSSEAVHRRLESTADSRF